MRLFDDIGKFLTSMAEIYLGLCIFTILAAVGCFIAAVLDHESSLWRRGGLFLAVAIFGLYVARGYY
jgi:hypothetical protein